MTDFKKFVIINTDKENEEKEMVEKNKKKLLDKSQRVWYNMNTGTRVHKDAKHPSRNKIKKDFKKMLDKLENL